MSGFVLLGGWLSLFWLAIVWWLTMDRATNVTTTTYIALASMFAVVVNSPGIWIALATGYSGDSFATLSFGGQAGVIVISTLGLAGIYVFSAAKSRWILGNGTVSPLIIVADCFLSIALFGLVYAVSPQVYYTFYQFLFPDIPNQTVLRLPLAIDNFRDALALSPSGSLSAHLAGIGWLGIVPFTLWFHAKAAPGTGMAVFQLALGWFWLQIAHFI